MRRVLLTVVALVMACTPENAARPAHVRMTSNGLCRVNLVLDANNHKLSGGGCEGRGGGLSDLGAVTNEQAQAVRDAFEPLKAGVNCLPADAGATTTGKTSWYTLYEGEQSTTWQTCAVVDAGVWTALDAAFNAL